MTWAQRLKRVFNIEICKTCGGHVKIIACIEDPVVIEKILTHLERKDASGAARRLPPCRGHPRPACSAETRRWCGGQLEMLEDSGHAGRLGNKCDETHRVAAFGASQRECLVDASD